VTYTDTRFRCLRVCKADACDTIRLFVKQHNVGDFSQLGAFFSDVLLDLQYSSWILL
jgi:hypothetical protein